MANPVHVSEVIAAELAASTERFRRHNDEIAESQRRERGSVPPPRVPAQPADLTHDRARAILKALLTNPSILTLVPLVQVDGGPALTHAEFGTLLSAGVKGMRSL